MNPPPIILHHHEPSAASARLRKIMALKDIAWRSCRLGNPKSEDGPLAMILAGKMGHPILQNGSTFWVSSLAVIDAIEELYPEPTLFPNGNCGMPLALSWWSDEVSAQASAEQVAAHAALIARQLVDGRDFLQGPAPGLADAQAYAGLSAAMRNLELSDFQAGKDQFVKAWFDRVRLLGEGGRQDISATEAREAAAAGKLHAKSAQHPLTVSKTGASGGCSIEGSDLGSNSDQISIEITEAKGAVTVHFPAIGYRAAPV